MSSVVMFFLRGVGTVKLDSILNISANLLSFAYGLKNVVKS